MAFVRVRIPETGVHVDVHEDSLAVHPTLQRLDRPPADRPRRVKRKRTPPPPAADAAGTEKE
jgi:hypothetical protein